MSFPSDDLVQLSVDYLIAYPALVGTGLCVTVLLLLAFAFIMREGEGEEEEEEEEEEQKENEQQEEKKESKKDTWKVHVTGDEIWKIVHSVEHLLFLQNCFVITLFGLC